jgi:tRNA pseudouridine38-40 synthase
MRTACLLLQGRQDFLSFCNQRKNLNYTDTQRTVAITIEQYPENRLCICFVGNRFLYKMVRTLVGTLVDVGLHKIALERIPKIITSKQRSAAGMTAPANGLCLYKIYY